MLRIALALCLVVASAPNFSMAFKMALLTITLSAIFATLLTISGEEIPKPIANGKSVLEGTRLMKRLIQMSRAGDGLST